MLRTFLWVRGAHPQKCLRPNTCGYSYNNRVKVAGRVLLAGVNTALTQRLHKKFL